MTTGRPGANLPPGMTTIATWSKQPWDLSIASVLSQKLAEKFPMRGAYDMRDSKKPAVVEQEGMTTMWIIKQNVFRGMLPPRWLAALLLCAVSLVHGDSFTFAQTMGTGSISGTVTDSTGAVIPGVEVTAIEAARGTARTATTNSSGYYKIVSIRAGTYEIKAQFKGFKTFERKGVILDSDSTIAVDITLQVGDSRQTIIVSAAPPLLQTETGAVRTVVSGHQVSELALNGRNFTQFLTLGPGVASTTVGRRMGVGQEGNPLMSINGGRVNSNMITYDGQLAMDTSGNRGLQFFPPMQTIQEVQIHKSNDDAEDSSYGYSMLNVVTKSGGSEYHGAIYYALGNQAVDARNFFAAAVAPFKQNIFGFTIGGPLFPSKQSRYHNKLYFFFSQGWNRRRGPQMISFLATPTVSTFTALTPDAKMRQGDFSGLATIKDPMTGQPFSNNTIPPGRIDPNAAILLQKYYPLPNRAGVPNYVSTPSSVTNWNQPLARVDAIISDKDRLMVRFIKEEWAQAMAVLAPTAPQGSFPTIGGEWDTATRGIVINWTHTFNPTTLNEFSANFARKRLFSSPRPLSAAQRPAGLNIPTILNQNLLNTIPGIQLGQGYASIASTTNQINFDNVYEYKDKFTHVVSGHTLKAGFEATRKQKFFFRPNSGQQGLFTFTGSFTGNAVADFLLGNAFAYTEQALVPPEYLFATAYDMYIQDSWKVRPNLTINYGLRNTIYVGAPCGLEKFDHISIFVPALYDPLAAPNITPSGRIVPGTGDPLNGIITPTNQKGLHLPRSLRMTRSDNLGPRVGFAWSLGSARKTVLRGGYGIFHGWDNNTNEALSFNPPFSTSVAVYTTTLSNPAGGTSVTFPPSIRGHDYNNLYPSVHQWNMTLERELPGSVVLSVAYVGNHAVHLTQNRDINQPTPSVAVANGTVNAQTVRPFLGYTSITFEERSASARYNGLQIDARRRFRSGFEIEAAYTYSKSLEMKIGQVTSLELQEKGRSDLDRTHIATISYLYEFPFFKNQQGPLGKFLGGWEISGITTFQSGVPFTVVQSGDRAGVGGGSQRPDLVGPIQRDPRNVNQFFTTAAFTLAPLGRFGTAGRNIIRGPGLNNWDISVSKNTKIHFYKDKIITLRARFEFFNAFNRANFDSVGATFASATFGRILSANDPRHIALSMEIVY